MVELLGDGGPKAQICCLVGMMAINECRGLLGSQAEGHASDRLQRSDFENGRDEVNS